MALVAAEVVPLVPLALREARGRLHAFDPGPCGVGTPAGYDPAEVNAALGRLHGGRLAYDPKGLLACAIMTDLDFASSAPIASPFVAGAHVGVIATAFDHLQPAAPGSDARATVLGVGYLLLPAAQPAPTGAGWSMRDRLGPVTLYETPSSYFGLGCRRELWRGDDRHVRESLDAALVDPTSPVWSPTEWIEIDAHGFGPVVRTVVGTPCDASHARLLEARRLSAGRYRARVSSPAEVDVVLRETFFGSWDVEVDGIRTKPVLVAPGFMSVHLGSGEHVVTARFRTSWGYLLGLLLALSALVGLASSSLSRRAS
jgi:hypothetical protein